MLSFSAPADGAGVQTGFADGGGSFGADRAREGRGDEQISHSLSEG